MTTIGQFARLRRGALEALMSYGPQAGDEARIALLQNHVDFLSARDSHSFLLPENGLLLAEGAPARLTLENFRMPFPRCVLEYSVRPDHYVSVQGGTGKWTPDATVLEVHQDSHGGPITATCVWRDDDDGRRKWVPSFAGFKIDDGSTIELRRDGNVTIDLVQTGVVHQSLRGQETLLDYVDELKALCQFVVLCNCANVKPQKVFEPSAALMKRSEARGKLPPDSYWVLDCALGEGQERIDRGGTHASPRLHVRRGHVRQLEDGRLTWVRQTSVGSRALGTITKDYRVR